MTKQDAIKLAIARIIGQPCELGSIVAFEAHPLTWKLDSYDRINVNLSGKDNEKITVLRSEIFDVKKAINIANHFINLGFWEEGMESTIFSIAPK